MLKKLIFLVLVLFSLGNLSSVLRDSGFNLYLYDPMLLGLNLIILVYLIKRGYFQINLSFLLFGFFIFLALINTIFINLKISEINWITSLAYLVRFINYGMFGFLIYMLIKSKTLLKSDINSILYWNFILVLALNFLQFFLFRDISFFSAFGFDPHQTRLTGTFLDPNFMGIYLILIFIYSQSNPRFKYLGIVSFVQILLTDSRSAVICLILALVLLALKKPKYLLYLVFVFVFGIFSSLNQRFELASRSNDSISLRYASWSNALTLYEVSPYFGVGFNNYKNFMIFHNLLRPEEYNSNFSNSSDSSLLSVFVMTGFIGLLLYIAFLTSFLNLKNFIYLLVVLVNSVIVNSLFFPQIIVLLLLILNLNFIED